jgi:hypothetical protein
MREVGAHELKRQMLSKHIKDLLRKQESADESQIPASTDFGFVTADSCFRRNDRERRIIQTQTLSALLSVRSR